MKDGGADHLARSLGNMPDKQAAALIAIEFFGQRTSYLDRALETGLSLEAYMMVENRAPWAFKKTLKLPGAAEAHSFFQEGCQDNRLTLQPRQLA